MSTDDSVAAVLIKCDGGVAIAVKAVPGASRSKVVRVLGDRLKVAVTAPPEGGKANNALCALLADVFNVPPRDVRVTAGQTRPQKTVQVDGVGLCEAVERLEKVLG